MNIKQDLHISENWTKSASILSSDPITLSGLFLYLGFEEVSASAVPVRICGNMLLILYAFPSLNMPETMLSPTADKPFVKAAC